MLNNKNVLNENSILGNFASPVSVNSSHILSSFNALMKALWLPVFDKEVTFHSSAAFEASNNVHLLSFPLSQRIQTPPRKYAFSTTEIKKNS